MGSVEKGFPGKLCDAATTKSPTSPHLGINHITKSKYYNGNHQIGMQSILCYPLACTKSKSLSSICLKLRTKKSVFWIDCLCGLCKNIAQTGNLFYDPVALNLLVHWIFIKMFFSSHCRQSLLQLQGQIQHCSVCSRRRKLQISLCWCGPTWISKWCPHLARKSFEESSGLWSSQSSSTKIWCQLPFHRWVLKNPKEANPLFLMDYELLA